jgi:hypothetical protein
MVPEAGMLVNRVEPDESNSGNSLGNSQTSSETRRLRVGYILSRAFPETRKRHAAAYRVRVHLFEYARTHHINVESIGGGPADTGC